MPINTLGQPNPRESLRIFDSFRVDRSLPKYAKREPTPVDPAGTATTTLLISTNSAWTDTISVSQTTDGLVWPLVNQSAGQKEAPSLLRWLRKWWAPKPPHEVPVTEVFATIKASAQELVQWEERDQVLQSLLAQVQRTGQAALLQQLKATMAVRRFENALFVKGRRKLITEKQLLEFSDKCERGLCLDWITDFTRFIPEEVVMEKVRCDEAHLFDNYVVLHYDPQNRGTRREDRERAKDPILFGVIQGSRKLYFVGDWVDEHCDLTFEDLIAQLGDQLEIQDDQKSS